MVTGRTFDFGGIKEVSIQTTRVKMGFTLLMGILSNEVVLPPLFIFKENHSLRFN